MAPMASLEQPLQIAWSKDPNEDEYPQLPTGFHSQKFIGFIKSHVGKLMPRREPPATETFPARPAPKRD